MAAPIVGTDTWPGSKGFGAGGGGTYSWLTGQPGPPDTGITTARRKRWSLSPTSNSGSGFDVKASAANYFGPVAAGQVVTASCWMRASVTGKRLAMSLEFSDRVAISGHVVVGGLTTGTPVDSLAGLWLRVAVTATVPSGGVGIITVPQVLDGGTLWNPGEILDATGLLIEKSAALGTYFDGASGPGFTWAGDPNASTSVAQLGTWRWQDFGSEIKWLSLSGVGI